MNSKPDVLSVMNSKGGVGKHTVLLNLSHALILNKKQVVILDTSFDTSYLQRFGWNLKIIESIPFGNGAFRLNTCELETRNGAIRVLFYDQNTAEYATPTLYDLYGTIAAVEERVEGFDYVLVGTGSSKIETAFVLGCIGNQQIFVIDETPESVGPAIELMQQFHKRFGTQHASVLVNRVRSKQQGLDQFHLLINALEHSGCDLGVSYLGAVYADTHVYECNNKHCPILDYYPRSKFSRSVSNIAANILRGPRYEDNCGALGLLGSSY